MQTRMQIVGMSWLHSSSPPYSCTLLASCPCMHADGGLRMDVGVKDKVNGLINRLEILGNWQQPRPLQNPLIWGHYDVAYTASSDQGQRGFCLSCIPAFHGVTRVYTCAVLPSCNEMSLSKAFSRVLHNYCAYALDSLEYYP
jgi:hypothetical protein